MEHQGEKKLVSILRKDIFLLPAPSLSFEFNRSINAKQQSLDVCPLSVAVKPVETAETITLELRKSENVKKRSLDCGPSSWQSVAVTPSHAEGSSTQELHKSVKTKKRHLDCGPSPWQPVAATTSHAEGTSIPELRKSVNTKKRRLDFGSSNWQSVEATPSHAEGTSTQEFHKSENVKKRRLDCAPSPWQSVAVTPSHAEGTKNVDCSHDNVQLVRSTDSNLSGRKKRFPIGAWQAQRKILPPKLQLLETQVCRKKEEISELNKDIEWRERLLVNLERPTTVERANKSIQVACDPANQLFAVQNGLKHRKATDVKCPTLVLAHASDTAQLTKVQARRRVRKTIDCMKGIHGDNIKNVCDGLWYTLVKASTPSVLRRYVTKSKSCQSVLSNLGKVSKRRMIQERRCPANVVRSIKMLYKGGLVSSRKYVAIRSASIGVSKPEPLTYNEVREEIDKVREDLSVSLLEGGKGCYRDLETTLVKLAKLYLQLDEIMIQNHGVGLNWLNKSRGEFSIAIGADGAPAGKLGTHTSLLLSFLNTTDRVGSCDHNFLLCGGDVTEDDPTFLNHLSKIIKDMTEIEKREYIIGSDRVKFKLEMIPADCKWAAVACGELSNAATYPSTFGNVHKDELSKLNASIGFESHNTWQPWGYQQRMAHAKEVSRVKEKVNVRGKVLKTIANMRSRQEFEPVIGKYSDKCYLEPLHVKNNACQQLNIQLLFDVIARTEDRVLKMDLQSDEFLASPIGQYLYSLKNTVKAGKLHTRLLRWFKESRNNLSKEGVVKCTIRFTGEDSMKFLNHFPYLIEALNKPAEKSNFVKYRQLLFHVASTLLREIVALSSKIKFSQFELEQLKASCEMYHALHALFFTKVTLTTWHIGYALPFHANLIYSKFGVGLGINTMQGREAKHRQISNYAKFTIPQQKWTGIFRHEYIHLIWLKEHDLSEAAKEIAKKRDHSKYHVSQISPDLCSCGLSAASSICIFCNHPGRKLILESIAKRRVLAEVRQLME